VLVHDLEHFLGLEMLEARPAAIFVGAPAAFADAVLAFGEDAAFELPELEAGGLVFLQRVEVVEALEKEEVGDLLDDFEGIGNAAGPEGISEGVNLTADLAGEHGGIGGSGVAGLGD
jgi:hypothetical protein